MTQACQCKDWACGLPACEGCGEDHGGTEYEGQHLCRDCFQDAAWKRIADYEERNPGSLERRLAELFGSKKARR